MTAFWLVTNEPEFSLICGLQKKIKNNNDFNFRLLPAKRNDKIFQEAKNSISGLFWASFTDFGANMNFFWKSVSVTFFCI